MSLYSGCGGLDLGFIQKGYRCLGAFDIDPIAVQTYNRNMETQAERCDLDDYIFSSEFVGVDVLLAGPPCQGFSTLGKRVFDDPRNGLLLRVGNFASLLDPNMVVVENVSGVVSGKHKEYWQKLAQELVSHGYTTQEFVCDANMMGVPQKRKRLFMIGHKGSNDITIECDGKQGGVLEDAITDLSGASNHDPMWLRQGSDSWKIARRIGQSQKLCNVRAGPRSVHTWDVPEVFGKTTRAEREVLHGLLRLRRQQRVRDFGDSDPVSARRLYQYLKFPVVPILEALRKKGYVRRKNGLYDLSHTFNGKYRRLALSKPSPTVDTYFGDPRYFLHPTEDRGFTVREAARIQGFPDLFSFVGSIKAQYRLIGNAVPPPVGYNLASFFDQVEF